MPQHERLISTWSQPDTIRKYRERFKVPSVRAVRDKTDAMSLSLQRFCSEGPVMQISTWIWRITATSHQKSSWINNRESYSSAAEVQEKKGIFITLRIPQLWEIQHIRNRKWNYPRRKTSVKWDLSQITSTSNWRDRHHRSCLSTFQRLLSPLFE